MPITRSAQKAMRQNARAAARNQDTKTRLKTFVKKVLTLAKSDPAEAQKMLPAAYKVIDTAAKKNLIHKNNAARKKSLLARTVGGVKSKKKAA